MTTHLIFCLQYPTQYAHAFNSLFYCGLIDKFWWTHWMLHSYFSELFRNYFISSIVSMKDCLTNDNKTLQSMNSGHICWMNHSSNVCWCLGLLMYKVVYRDIKRDEFPGVSYNSFWWTNITVSRRGWFTGFVLLEFLHNFNLHKSTLPF